VGMENSHQFESTYMSYLVNKIVRDMINNRGKGYSDKFLEENFIDKERKVKS
jgi:hypothetical protein